MCLYIGQQITSITTANVSAGIAYQVILPFSSCIPTWTFCGARNPETLKTAKAKNFMNHEWNLRKIPNLGSEINTKNTELYFTTKEYPIPPYRAFSVILLIGGKKNDLPEGSYGAWSLFLGYQSFPMRRLKQPYNAITSTSWHALRRSLTLLFRLICSCLVFTN